MGNEFNFMGGFNTAVFPKVQKRVLSVHKGMPGFRPEEGVQRRKTKGKKTLKEREFTKEKCYCTV